MEQSSSAQGPRQRSASMANIRYGVYSQPANIAGKTVKEVRDQYSKIWGIPTDAVAMVGKDRIDENAVVQPGQNIEFFRKAGEKGTF
jgi:hypothetical protein